MRDWIIINSKLRQRGNGWCILITKEEKDIIGIGPEDDLQVEIRVAERKSKG